MEVGDTITLKGKSLKGKNRIREAGAEWVIQKISEGTPFRDEGDILVAPLSQVDAPKPRKGMHPSMIIKMPQLRWITKNDKDFEIEQEKQTEEN